MSQLFIFLIHITYWNHHRTPKASHTQTNSSVYICPVHSWLFGNFMQWKFLLTSNLSVLSQQRQFYKLTTSLIPTKSKPLLSVVGIITAGSLLYLICWHGALVECGSWPTSPESCLVEKSLCFLNKKRSDSGGKSGNIKVFSSPNFPASFTAIFEKPLCCIGLNKGRKLSERLPAPWTCTAWLCECLYTICVCVCVREEIALYILILLNSRQFSVAGRDCGQLQLGSA